MKKIKDWAMKNRGIAVILLLTIIFLIILIVIFTELLIGGSSNKYGTRLDGIADVKITKDTYDGVKEELTDTGLIESVEIRLQGKIVYTTIVLKNDTSVDKAKEIASLTLDNYQEDELNFYDFSYFLKWESEEETKVITGNKHHNLDEITWVNS